MNYIDKPFVWKGVIVAENRLTFQPVWFITVQGAGLYPFATFDSALNTALMIADKPKLADTLVDVVAAGFIIFTWRNFSDRDAWKDPDNPGMFE